MIRQLRGDLDAIALRALVREPAQRYPTVLALEQDLRRYLNGEPIQAQPSRLAYRFGKFVQRHKTAAVAILVATVVVLGTVGYALRRQVAAPEIVNVDQGHQQGRGTRRVF